MRASVGLRLLTRPANMPFLYIRTCDADVSSLDEGADYAHGEDALEHGVRGGMEIACEEIHRGKRSAAVDVCIEDPTGQTLLRTMIAVSVSPLLVPDKPSDSGRPAMA